MNNTIKEMIKSKKENEEPKKEIKDVDQLDIKKFAIWGFIVPPLIVSIISMLHLWEFFRIANAGWMAFVISLCFELISIASLLALTILDKISKSALWIVFIGVAIYQIIGNVYASFVFIGQDNSLLKDFVDMFWMQDTIASKRFVAIIQGACLPILSLTLIKLAINYFEEILDGNSNKTIFYKR